MPKKIPLRQCLGCREMKPKKELIRVVRPPEDSGGVIHLDFRGKDNGRGAYVCPNPDCLKKAIRSHGLERAFGSAIPEEIYTLLTEQMEGRNDGGSD